MAKEYEQASVNCTQYKPLCLKIYFFAPKSQVKLKIIIKKRKKKNHEKTWHLCVGSQFSNKSSLSNRFATDKDKKNADLKAFVK